MQKPTSAADTPIRVVIVTMDTHLATATQRARARLVRQMPGLKLSMHAASEWGADDALLSRCIEDIRHADIIVATMLFMEDHFMPVLSELEARRKDCDAIVCAMSASEVVRLTRIGKFDMGKPATGLTGLLKRLRGNKDKTSTGGAAQMKMLRRVPKLLRFIPGTAQDVRAYFITLQYWLGGSEENMFNMIRFLINRYASGPREALRGADEPTLPIQYPDLGVYHPRMKSRLSENASDLPVVVPKATAKGVVGVLLLRSYLLSGNSGHYDGVITALEAQGLSVVPAFASGLDARPAVEEFFIRKEDGKACVDAVVSLSGFSLVGGPAYNDSKAAEEILAKLDVPYIAAHPVEFQTINQWGASERGLMPVESTIMVAIPELDGATTPMVFGGRVGEPGTSCTGCHKRCTFDAGHNVQDMHACSERAHMLATRIEKMIALRKKERADKKVAIVLFNFPPNAGNTGTAAHLSVFESLFNVMMQLKSQGYTVDLPLSVDELRNSIINGNKAQYGTDANVHTLISSDDHVRRERWLSEIEAQWGPAPGKQLSNGSQIFILGRQFGNLLLAIQPSMGHEGDPMRLLFERGFSPTHAFSAFYRYLREDFGADAALHFGTHGALEFMPGKQSGMSGSCWPDRLIADLPNLYLYASNNPSEGALAKRRAGATLISYLTPPVSQAGLYKGLVDLKALIDRWRALDPAAPDQQEVCDMLQAQAAELELCQAEPRWIADQDAQKRIHDLYHQVLELEYTLIPHGLHVVGAPSSEEARVDMLLSMADASRGLKLDRKSVSALVKGELPEEALARNFEQPEGLLDLFKELARANELMLQDSELDGIVRALDGRYIRPAPGGDVLRTPDVLPTGRNLHGFDPFKIPSLYAVRDGARQAERLLARYAADGNQLPESIAMVLWGTDNLKTEGSPIAQALALMGALPRFDSYGRVAGAVLIPLAELGRPRIDVVITLSGIFRDLMPLQIKLLAEAAFLAASADEPAEQNFVRKHALAFQAEHNCSLEDAALRVYGNAEGTYGSNVNALIENGRWDDETELAETYSRRKGFAYGRTGRPVQQAELLQSVLKSVSLTYQNLESIELGVTTVDTYFDTLGGITGAVKRAKGGEAPPVYIGDQTRGDGTVRTLSEQVALETRTRTLNPKWYEGMLAHGYEGVRQIEVQITNTMGWSATTGQVQPWVYQQFTQTFLLDPQMRDRLAKLNPTASAKLANRLIEASERKFWKPDSKTLQALREAGEELEDRLEGIYEGATT